MDNEDDQLPDVLLPCPFCGSIVDMEYSNFIRCPNTLDCGAQMESGDSDVRTERERMIAAWNRRS